MTNLLTKASLQTDPLMPHLLDILSLPASEGLILAGGFGMRIKQADFEEQITGGRTLLPSVPLARSTQDLDLFLSMEIWTQKEQGKAVRAMLDGLNYEVIPEYKNLQFGKLRDPITSKFSVKIDLHARVPNEKENVKFDSRRVGLDTGKMVDREKDQGVGLHGRTTPEAFAIDNMPKMIQVTGRRTDGTDIQATVLVPHPYASLNMKIKAAHDWLRATRGEAAPKVNSEKHIFDVYLLIAMMLDEELDECRTLTEHYVENPMATENRQNAIDLFASPNERGFNEVLRQIGDLSYDYATFWEGLKGALGIPE